MELELELELTNALISAKSLPANFNVTLSKTANISLVSVNDFQKTVDDGGNWANSVYDSSDTRTGDVRIEFLWKGGAAFGIGFSDVTQASISTNSYQSLTYAAWIGFSGELQNFRGGGDSGGAVADATNYNTGTPLVAGDGRKIFVERVAGMWRMGIDNVVYHQTAADPAMTVGLDSAWNGFNSRAQIVRYSPVDPGEINWTFNLGSGATVTKVGNTIQRTTGTADWTGYFWSTEQITNGYVEIQPEATAVGDGFFGFSDLATITGYSDISGLWISGALALQIDNKGAISGSASFAAGDTLRVTKKGSAYSVQKNGVETGLAWTGPAGACRLAGVKEQVGPTLEWLNCRMVQT